MLALVGLGVVAGSLFVLNHADWRHELEEQLYGWLQEREAERLVEELDNRPPSAVVVATAELKAAPPAASSVLEMMAANAQAAFDLAIESSFNPFAQSSVGAQGLMQVMTRIHDDKYQAFGGKLTAFDPVTNLRVGVQVLSECIAKAGGSLEEGLKYYVGATNLDSDDGYAARVLNEQQFLTRVASGQKVPTSVSNQPVMAPPPQPEASPVAHASPAQVALLRAESSALTLH
ncbi:lytic transglycosylase domain-containing protein [Vitreoscilla filiformis]|nr:lytic transglycosylase domain-containing protein [Vitreoscilla filiformis]